MSRATNLRRRYKNVLLRTFGADFVPIALTLDGNVNCVRDARNRRKVHNPNAAPVKKCLQFQRLLEMANWATAANRSLLGGAIHPKFLSNTHGAAKAISVSRPSRELLEYVLCSQLRIAVNKKPSNSEQIQLCQKGTTTYFTIIANVCTYKNKNLSRKQ